MTTGEMIRVVVLLVVGALLTFLLQPLMYKQGIFWEPNVQNPQAALEGWVSTEYMKAALAVFGVSAFCTVLWSILTTNSKAHTGQEVKGWILFWWLLGLAPLLSIGVAIGLLNQTPEPRLSMAMFFVLDIGITYWLTTASSTPGLVRYTPPLSHQIRNLIGAE